MRLKADRRKPMHNTKFGRNTLYLSRNDPRKKLRVEYINTVSLAGKRLPKLANTNYIKCARIWVFSDPYTA